MSKDCPNPFSNVTEDGKPREAYIPQEITDENELFQGIKSGSAFDNFDRVAVQVSKFCKMFYLQLTCSYLVTSGYGTRLSPVFFDVRGSWIAPTCVG